MISVVIPTLNAEKNLPATLAALVPAVVKGVVRQVIIADGGSTDRTIAIADDAGADFLSSEPGRGAQLAAGAKQARASWLLFLHADTVLEEDWCAKTERFMERVEQGRRPPAAAAFRYALDDQGLRPRFLEAMVGLRCALLHMPYGDQGLLIHRTLYFELGEYRLLPLMEDVDIVRRLGYRRVHMLDARAVTSASRYRQNGYFNRILRNTSCIVLYFLRVPPRYLIRLYG